VHYVWLKRQQIPSGTGYTQLEVHRTFSQKYTYVQYSNKRDRDF